jgi:hypothetical protein
MQTLLPGITAERVPTRRLHTAVLAAAGRTGDPVLFVHGNVRGVKPRGTPRREPPWHR